MLRVSQVPVPVDHDESILRRKIARILNVPPAALGEVKIHKKSIDARGVKGVAFGVTADVNLLGTFDEAKILAQQRGKGKVQETPDETYVGLDGVSSEFTGERPIIVGSGPCGLLCALLLSRHGRKPLLLERGKAAGDRARDVTGFWRRGLAFDPESNVQYGEGGAGTFSDGKLYTQIKDREHRIRWLLQELVEKGAPEDILTKGRPHIGTDRLIKVVRNIREEIIANGGEVRFGSKVTGLVTDGNKIAGVEVNGEEKIAAKTVVVAVGHSARDMFEILQEAGARMEPKSFSIGVRIEHPQKVIDNAQLGEFAGHSQLGAAPYKIVHHCKNGRAAYSFCMCPGGLVVAAGSEPETVVTNGMSSYARAEANANSGLMVDVRPGDFKKEGRGALAGIDYQRKWERAAFVEGGGDYHAPAQTVADFLAGKPSTKLGKVASSYEPGVRPGDLRKCLPKYVIDTLKEAIPRIDARALKGFAMRDAVMVGVETRSSSPLRVMRDPETFQSTSIKGLYPAGEGAGYAGGIISAAADGMKVAEVLLRKRRI